MEEENHDEEKSFKELGLCDALVEACTALGWKHAFKIQSDSIPHALQGKDIIGTAQTGSGKTGAFALPIIQALLEAKTATPFFGLVLVPTRELAIQIAEQFKALGSGISLKTAVLIGGVDMNQQQLALAKRPHIVVATPGRLMDHLTNTRGFSLQTLKYLVLDEADKILNEEFEKSIDDILKEIPRERRTYLFSATMTDKVMKLQRACLRNPVKIESASNNSTNDTLKQELCVIPAKYKDCYLLYVLMEISGRSVVFTNRCDTTHVVALMLRNLGLSALPINGKMTQAKRLGALNKFKAGDCNILVASNVLSRGHDMPFDMVINYEIPTNPEDYLHRVGRTARAGRTGVAISLVSQYEVAYFQHIENLIGKTLVPHPVEEEEVSILLEHVTKAKRIAHMKIKESGGRKREGMVDEEREEIQKYLDRQHSRKSNKRHRR